MKLFLIFSLALTFLSVDSSLPYSLPERYEDIFVLRDLPLTVTPSLVTFTVSSGTSTTAPVLVTLITSSSSTPEPLSGAPFHTAPWNSSSTAASVETSSIANQSSSPEDIGSATPTLNYPNSTVEGRSSYVQTSSDSTLFPNSKLQPSSPSISISPKSSQAPDSLFLPYSSLFSVSISAIANQSILPSESSGQKSDSRTKFPITVTATVSASNGVPSTVTIITPTQAEEDETMSSPQTSQTPAASAAIPVGSGLEVMLGNVPYQLPSSGERPMEVMLTNGSIAQLFANRVILETQTITVPLDISSATELPGGITVKPAEASTPNSLNDNDDNDGHHGGGGLFGALGSIAGGAKSALGGAINDISAVSTPAMAFAGGTAGITAGFADSLKGAIGGTSNLVASFNGIQKSFSGSQLSKSALDTLTGAHSLSRQSLNWMKSTQNLIEDFANLPADVQSKLRERVGDFAKKGGQLAQCKQALEMFQKFPWEEAELPNPSPTVTPRGRTQSIATDSFSSAQSSSVSQSKTSPKFSTKPQSRSQSESTTTSSQTSSSSSGTPTPTAETIHEYYISSKEGIEWPKFENLTKEIDTVKGTIVRWDIIGAYMCLARMNATQAAEIEKAYDFIERVGLNEGEPGLDDLDGSVEHFRAISMVGQAENAFKEAIETLSVRQVSEKVEERLTRLSKRTMGTPDPNAPWWKQMLSAPPSGPNETPLIPSEYPGYLADDTGGSGTTIYVVDDGFDTLLSDLASNGRLVTTHVVPNEFTLSTQVRNRGVPEDIRGPPGERHGTIMAILAGGSRTGVAPKADLHLIKAKGHYYHTSGTGTSPSFHKETSISYWIRHIKMHIEERRRKRQNGGPEVRSVVSMSSGVKSSTYGPEVRESIRNIFQTLLDYCQENQIPFVVAAGNTPTVADVNENIPHVQSRPQDSMIIVGGVNREGGPFTYMPADSNRLVHVWSPAQDIETPISSTEVRTDSGTSQAAAIVSGLIAYYYGLPNFNHDHADVNGGFEGAKGLVNSHAWARSPADPSIKVVYNLARGDLLHDTFPCIRRRGIVGNLQSSGFCSASSVSATSASSLVSSILATPTSSSVFSVSETPASSLVSATSVSTAVSSSSMLSKASSITPNSPTSLSSRSPSFSSTKTRDTKPTSAPQPSTSTKKSSSRTSKPKKSITSTKTSQAPAKPTKSQRPQGPQWTGEYLSPLAPTSPERKHSCLGMVGLNSVYCIEPPAEAVA